MPVSGTHRLAVARGSRQSLAVVRMLVLGAHRLAAARQITTRSLLTWDNLVSASSGALKALPAWALWIQPVLEH